MIGQQLQPLIQLNQSLSHQYEILLKENKNIVFDSSHKDKLIENLQEEIAQLWKRWGKEQPSSQSYQSTHANMINMDSSEFEQQLESIKTDLQNEFKKTIVEKEEIIAQTQDHLTKLQNNFDMIKSDYENDINLLVKFIQVNDSKFQEFIQFKTKDSNFQELKSSITNLLIENKSLKKKLKKINLNV